MELILRRRFRVASYNVGPGGTARPSAIMGFLEEAAGAQSGEWELSVPHLLRRGLTWVLSRYHLRLLRPLHFGEEVEVATWPSARSTLFALRDFEVTGDDGAVVALATTSWVVIDLASKRPRPLKEVVHDRFALDRRALLDDFAALPKLGPVPGGVELPVMLRDLDMNLHVNHVVYVQWALEAVPLPLLQAGWPTDIEIGYQAEAFRGDRIVSTAEEQAGQEGKRVFIHRIAHAGTGVELARLRTTW